MMCLDLGSNLSLSSCIQRKLPVKLLLQAGTSMDPAFQNVEKTTERLDVQPLYLG